MLTYRCDRAIERGGVQWGRAVPTTVSELVLTLFPAQPRAISNHLHDLLVARADPSLVIREIEEFVTNLMLRHVAELVASGAMLPLSNRGVC